MSKGTCLLVGNEWYVAVHEIDGGYACICDHANNTFLWKKEDARIIASAKDLILADGWRNNDDLMKHLEERPCPYRVIAEVLSGVHDDRF